MKNWKEFAQGIGLGIAGLFFGVTVFTGLLAYAKWLGKLLGVV